MAGNQNGGLGTLATVAFLAFLAGRCSVDDTPVPAAEAPSYLADTTQPPFAEPEAPAPAPAPVPQPPPRQPVRLVEPVNDGPVYFRNCSHARALGRAPVRAGDPGYSRKLDRDGDGVGCE